MAVVREGTTHASASVLLSSLMHMTMQAHADLAGYCQGALKIFWQPLGNMMTATAQYRVSRPKESNSSVLKRVCTAAVPALRNGMLVEPLAGLSCSC